MELWILLLLHFHLGNAPWIEVVPPSLPSPSNVLISSFNMEHTLSFLPGALTPSDAHFTVQILRSRKNLWRTVGVCAELKAGQTCNLTKALKDPYDDYKARVQAVALNRTSNWTVSGWFQPLTDTVLGPPAFSVSGCGNCLMLQLRAPTQTVLPKLQLQDLYGDVVFHVRRTRDDSQFRLHQPYKEEIVIPHLQPGVEYCVTVTVTSFTTTHTVSSKPQCAFTSPPPPRHSLYIISSLLGAFCAVAFILVGLVMYGSRLSFKLLKYCLPKSLLYVFFQGQHRSGALPDLSRCVSASQPHDRGSSGRLRNTSKGLDCR
ncbi:interferon alpha/beta receptor 2-like isoform X2 [Mugil cephalus]|uniref:interferon alpha/beta receptor 2-like isoform X2 n=1 Tax=Mugil cephalus TaxID=48193 RepID=UPI001FB7D5B3|nr:interferon alpha/beta receptor 2-like isoform X2 [Mugil cephalus]